MSDVVERERDREAAARGGAGLASKEDDSNPISFERFWPHPLAKFKKFGTRDTSEKVCTSVWHRLFQRSLDVLQVVELRCDLFIRFLTVCSRLLVVESVRLL